LTSKNPYSPIILPAPIQNTSNISNHTSDNIRNSNYNNNTYYPKFSSSLSPSSFVSNVEENSKFPSNEFLINVNGNSDSDNSRNSNNSGNIESIISNNPLKTLEFDSDTDDSRF
jgi:hypothetical protein